MDSKDLQRRFKNAGWPGPVEIQALLAEAGRVTPDEVEKLLSILVSKGLPGDSRDQRNRGFIFAKLAEPVADKSLFVPFVRAIKNGDAQIATILAPLLPRVNNVEGHAELVGILKTHDPTLRKAVAQILKQIGGTTVFGAVTALCSQRDFDGRIETMDVAVAIGRQHAIPALASILTLGSPMEKGLALQHLSNAEIMAKDTAGAAKAIAQVINDPNERVAMQAVTSFAVVAAEDDYLRHAGPLLDAENVNMAKAAIEGLRRFRSARTLDVLERKLREGPNALRLAVLGTLEAIAVDEVVPLAVAALNFKKIDVRNRAGEVLTNLAVGAKVDIARTLMWLLRSRDVDVRRLAVDIAKRVGDPSGELAPKLLRHLRDEDWWVRERVMDALVEMAGKQLTRHIVNYLQDPSDVVRRYAVDALDRIKDPAALGALVRAAQGDKDWWVRERAIEVIGAMNDPRSIPYVIELLKKEPELKFACVQALGAMKALAGAPHIAALLESEDVELRIAVLSALSAIDDRALAPQIAPMAQDSDHRVRDAATQMLTRWNAQVATGAKPQAAKTYSLLDRLLIGLAEQGGDDLILAGGHKPTMKKIGKVGPMAAHVFDAEQVRQLLLPCLNAKQIQDLTALKDVDFSYEIKAEALRFRANIFQQMPGLSAVFRIVKDKVPLLEELGLPAIAETFAELKNGLVLVGGPTGSGKSTTLAGIIDHINRHSSRHIITLEDPIEVLHKQKKSLINQREIGTHTRSFEMALRSTLREDPDVILVGEMRDLPTISFALTAAETGHLVLATLHTVSVDTSVDRLISAFPAGQQPQVRSLLADTLRAVMCQYLLKRKDREGRTLAVEILISNDAVANLIRKGKTFQLPQVITTGKDQGMQSMDSDLERLWRAGIIRADDAYMKAANKKNFETLVGMAAEAKPDGKREARPDGKHDGKPAETPAAGPPHPGPLRSPAAPAAGGR